MSDTSITDWITAIATGIGVPLSLTAFIKLIRRDKEREKQIATLGTISEQLSSQLQELSFQTAEFKLQSDFMSEHNSIIEQQLALQLTVHSEQRALDDQKLQLEKRARLMAIRPSFAIRHSSRMGISGSINLANQGAQADDLEVHKGLSIDVTLSSRKREVQRNNAVDLAFSLSNSNLSALHQFSITYKDEDVIFTFK